MESMNSEGWLASLHSNWQRRTSFRLALCEQNCSPGLCLECRQEHPPRLPRKVTFEYSETTDADFDVVEPHVEGL